MNEIPALAALAPSSMKAGDFDRDGDPDLLIQYLSGSWQAQIYMNTSTASTITFASTTHVFTGASTFVDWVDYNKDGWLDVLVNGGGTTSIYIQSNSTFSLLSGTLPGATAFGYFETVDTNNDTKLELVADNVYTDYDKDGDLDFFNDGLHTNREQTYVNTHTFWDGFKESQQTLRSPGFILDYDNNGQPDIAYVERSAKVEMATVYVLLNNGGAFTKFPIETWPTYNGYIQIAGFGDFNSNGKPELIVYINSMGWFGARSVHFYEYNTPNPSITYSINYTVDTYQCDMPASAVADFNGDGKLDVVTYHQYFDDLLGLITKFYTFRNTSTASNTHPVPPGGLTSAVEGGQVKLMWNRGTDSHTNPQGITYNLEIRNGVDYLITPNSLPSTRLLQPKKGNVQGADSVVLQLPNGRYDWTVSSVDGHNLYGIKSSTAQFEVTGSFDQPTTSTLTEMESIVTSDNRIVVAGQQSGDIYFQFLDSYGSRTTLPSKVNTGTTANSTPRIAYNPSASRFIVIWKGTSAAQGSKIWGRVFSASGAAVTAEFQISDVESSFPGEELHDYDVIYNSKRNNYRVVWSAGIDDITLRTRTINAATHAQSTIVVHRDVAAIPVFIIDKVRLEISPDAENILLAYRTGGIPFMPTPPDRSSFVELLNEDFIGGAPSKVDDVGVTSIAYNPNDSSFVLAFENYAFRTTDASSIFIETSEVKIGIAQISAFPTIKFINQVSQSFVQGGEGGAYSPGVALNLARNELLVLWRNTVDDRVHGRKINGYTKTLVGAEEFILDAFSGAVTDLEYMVDENQNFLAAGNYLSVLKLPKDPPPVIQRLRSDIAYAGDTLTIFGSNFGQTPYLNVVKFGDVEAEVDTVFFSTKKLRVTVPAGLTRDEVPVTVTFDDQTSNADVLFENLALQVVSAMDLTEAERGDVVTITGDRFVTDPTKLTVTFGPKAAEVSDFVSLTTTEIKVKIPQAALRGDWDVFVIIQGQPVNAGELKIFVTPLITSVIAQNSENTFVSCAPVVIEGQDFDNDPSRLSIKFGDVAVKPEDIIAVSLNRLNVKVPLGAHGNVPIRVTEIIGNRTGESENVDVYLGSSVLDVPGNPNIPDNIDIWQGREDDVTLSVVVRDECSVEEEGVKLWTKGISQTDDSWQSRSVPLTIARREVTLEELEFTDPIGLAAFFEIDDRSGETVYSDTFFIQPSYRELDSTNIIPDLVFGGNVSDYNIVSIPFGLSPNNIPSVFRDLVNNYGSDSSKWRLFHYLNDEGSSNRYIEYTRGLNVIEPGKGYWMIIRYPTDIFIDGAQTVDVSNNKPFSIELHNGWNQIGNPYNFNISWSDVLEYNFGDNLPANLESLKIYENGAFKQSDVLSRYRGGFVRYNGEVKLKLEIPYTKNNSINSRKKSIVNSDLSTENWTLPLTLSSPAIADETPAIGISRYAEDDVDPLDQHCLPKFSNQLDVAFTNNLSTSIQSAGTNRKWDFTINNSTGEDRLTLKWNNQNFGENDIGIFLYDKQSERMIDMRSTATYAFNYTANNNFTIYVGDEDFIANNLQPERVVLGDAYPNPFRNETTIPFTVVKDQTDVNIVMYNLQGQQISVLAQQTFDSGFYEVMWNGKDQNGNHLPAGAYMCQLQTRVSGQAKTQSKRVVVE